MSALLDRLRFFGNTTMGFNGKRDYYTLFGYKQTIDSKDLLFKFHRQGIAKRIVSSYPDTTWSDPPIVQSTDENWNKAWNDLKVQKNLYSAISRADKLAGVGAFSVLFIGYDDGLNTVEPLPFEKGKQNPRKILYFQPYRQDAVQIDSLFDDPTDARYMTPKIYKIKPNMDQELGIGAVKLPTVKEIYVHADRVLHIAQNTLENSYVGSPILLSVFNLLDDLLKVSGGSSEMYWLAANRGMQVNVDKETDLDPEDEQALTDEIEEYQHGLRRFMRTRGVDVKNLGSDVADPRGVFNILLSEIASATGIPQRVLVGAEAGQLASAQDRANWSDRVLEYRKMYAEPSIIWPLISKLTHAGVLPYKEGLKVEIIWPEAFHMSPLERAQAGAQRARSAINMAKARKEDPELVTLDEAREFIDLQKPNATFDDSGDFGV